MGATIGANATMVCGATIGQYAFLGAGAVVRGDVPDYALMVGVPAKQKGWMSRHGHRLQNPDENGVMVCPESGWHYQEVEPNVLRCLVGQKINHYRKPKMNKQVIDFPKLDKTAFSVVSLFDESDEKVYWWSKTPHQRLQHTELLRQINYGNKVSQRLQRFFEVAERQAS